jgi:hypothetical protein
VQHGEDLVTVETREIEPALGGEAVEPGLPVRRLAHEGHRPVGEAAALGRSALQDRHVAVAEIALDPLERGLDPPARTLQHLREGARVEHQRASHAHLPVVPL